MFSPLIILAAVFLFVCTVIVGLFMIVNGKQSTELEDRLDLLTTASSKKSANAGSEATLLTDTSLNDGKSFAETLFAHVGDIRKLIDQSGVTITPTQLLAMTIGSAVLGGFVCVVFKAPIWSVPLAAIACGAGPVLFLVFKRKMRLAKFGAQLPEALELISRALRAGHSLGAGFNLVGDEMAEPIRSEFARCYEEQNLGIPLEEAIDSMTHRVPNLDLKFFATAITLQRQTGGDLAEILDKIGHLIRERFKIFGQIQALTGEGRLSGIVLLALPPVLFIVMYRLNADYVMVLFRDEMGKKMLAFAVVMQLIGAYVIKKIINIRV